MNALNPARAELLETFGLDKAIVRGSGCELFDETGRSYLDFLAQYGALPFGHNPPRIWEALTDVERAGSPAMLQPLRSLDAERLAARLAQVTPGDLGIVTLANSGAETVEAALKLARVRTGRDGILSTWNGFHGKTLGALSATGKPVYQQDFAAPAPGFGYVPFGDLDALRARLAAEGDRIAAFIVEPIQGEGGMICPPEGYIDGAIALCREFGVLSILDEIQSGLGRTGALFACSDGAETPDMLLLAKALGGGLMPIGACIVRPSAWDDRFGRLHSSTFANNALAAKAACATLDALLADDGRLIADVARNGAHLRERLETLQARYPEVIREVRGRGYMLGLEFHPFGDRSDSATMAFASLNGGALALVSSYLMNVEGLLTAPLFNDSHVLRLQPPLVAGRAEIDRALAALEGVCGILHRGDYCALVRHLASTPPAPETARDRQPRPKSRTALAPQPGRFAFLIHYTEEEDVFRSDPSFRDFSRTELDIWLDRARRFGPGFARRIPQVTSRTGETAEGWLLSVPMLPTDMRGRRRQEAAAMICEAVDLAADAGAARLGLGAFTSIVTRGGDLARGRGVPITSGNTLTTVAAVQGLEQVARRVGIRIEDAHVAVVGASGAIGRLAALMLARRARRLTLVGNAANPFAGALMSKVAAEVEASSTAPGGIGPGGTWGRPPGAEALGLTWTTDLGRALDDADIVLVATSSETTLVDPRALRPGTLVCDVARPPNVARADLSGSGVLVFDGGLVQPPSPIDLGPFQTLPRDLCWGCLGETMLLALAREERDFSIGSRLTLEDADRIAVLAARHGFAPARPQWYGTDLQDADYEGLARHVRRGAVRGAPPLRAAGPRARVASA